MDQDQYDEHTIREVFGIVCEGQKIISEASDKDLIIFIGPTQTGKSTTINSLLGVHFVDYDARLIADPPDSLKAPIGSKISGGASCTKYPKIYISEESNKCFMDTQGFFDTRDDTSINVASNILLQMAINQARSVRAINLNNYDTIENGLSKFDREGKELCNFFNDENVPIYFLFNRFQPSNQLQKENFVNWPEEKKYKLIQNEIKKSCKFAIEAGEKQYKDCNMKILQRANQQKLLPKGTTIKDKINQKQFMNLLKNEEIQKIIAKDPENVKIRQKYFYITLLKNNLSKGYFGYIDPLSTRSIQQLLNDIDQLPVLDKSSLIFNGQNTERDYFDRIFKKTINKDIAFMRKLVFTRTFPEELIDNIIENIEHNIQNKQEAIEKIENKTIDENELNDLTNEFARETNEKIQDLIQTIDKLKEKTINDEQELKGFIEQGPIEVFHDDLSNSKDWGLYATHHTVYNKQIPFLYYTEDLDKNTKRDSVISTESPEFNVYYSAEKNKLLCWIPIVNIFYILAKIKCQGHVRIYAKAELADPEKYQTLKNNINDDNEQIGISKANLQNFKMAIESGIKAQIYKLVESLSQNLKKLKQIKVCVHEIYELSNQTIEENDNDEPNDISNDNNNNNVDDDNSNNNDDDDNSNNNDDDENNNNDDDNNNSNNGGHDDDEEVDHNNDAEDDYESNEDHGQEEEELDENKIAQMKFNKMTRLEKIESHKNTIDLLYKDSRNQTFMEFMTLFNQIKDERQNEVNIQVDLLIAEGNMIFNLDQ